jgi:hypothetical protein
MDTLKPVTRRRDDLLQDPRLWGRLYWSDLESHVGDAFHDGVAYFLGIGSQVANDLLDELESPQSMTHFPKASVTVPLRNGWRAGVIPELLPGGFRNPRGLRFE